MENSFVFAIGQWKIVWLLFSMPHKLPPGAVTFGLPVNVQSLLTFSELSDLQLIFAPSPSSDELEANSSLY